MEEERQVVEQSEVKDEKTRGEKDEAKA